MDAVVFRRAENGERWKIRVADEPFKSIIEQVFASWERHQRNGPIVCGIF